MLCDCGIIIFFSGRMSWNTSEDVLQTSWLRISLTATQLLARPQGVGEEVAFGLLQLPQLVKGLPQKQQLIHRC
jgi:hypothetical protein